jgi:hypothetical protein
MYRPGLSALRALREDRRGSISIITIGLFSILLITSLILTDITSIYLAKRNLTMAAEAAAQQGVSNLDKARYYKGEFNSTKMSLTVWGAGESDPGIPIDCEAGRGDAVKVLESWSNLGEGVSQSNLSEISMTDYSCDGFQIEVRVSGVAKLPIPIPFFEVGEVMLSSRVSTVGERASSNNYSGIDLG